MTGEANNLKLNTSTCGSTTQMLSGILWEKGHLFCWLSLKVNPYPKKGKKGTPGQQRPIWIQTFMQGSPDENNIWCDCRQFEVYKPLVDH